MEDLRNEIRAAFEREQAVYPPPGNLRPSLERPARNYQWMAVAAALVIGVLIVVSLVSSRATNRGTVTHPKATASPVGDHGTPPTGVPLFYLGDPNHTGWYIGFDWNGTPRATVKLNQPVGPDTHLQQSPDGSGFVLEPATKGGNGQYLDRLGRPIGGQFLYQPLQMWADDNKHYCKLDLSTPQPTLSLRTPGSDSAIAHSVALTSPDPQSGNYALGIGSCSSVHDRAVFVYNSFQRPLEVWVVRISDGKVLSDRTYATTFSFLTASGDGSLVAVNSAKSTGYIGGPTAPNTVIRRASDGTVVATLDPSYGVLAFSADDKFALVSTSPYAAGVPTHLAVVDLATDTVVWRYDGNQELSAFLVEPSGAAFAVMLQQPSDQSANPAVSLIMVYAYGTGPGTAVGIPGSFVRP